jgi:hydrogenase expression/formation protein HypD
VVFFAIGFETTTPPTAVALRQARAEGLKNFSVFCNHVLTPAAMAAILDAPGGVPLDGFVGPAHVSTVIGARPYERFARDYGKPVVIAGFEPLDVMQAIRMLIEQVNAGRAERRFSSEVALAPVPDHKACECGAILRGHKRPQDCKVFGTVCTPDNPIGACMVSSEGACAAHYSYGRGRDAPRAREAV